MRLNQPLRIWACYLIACSLYQMILYFQPAGMGSVRDPRLVWVLLFGGKRYVTPFIWTSAILTLAIGALGLYYRASPVLLVYVFSEFVLALPTVVYLVVSVVGGAGHLTLGPEGLLVQTGVYLLFSGVPFASASYLIAMKERGER